MSLPSSLSRCQATSNHCSITTSTLFEFLVPALYRCPSQNLPRTRSRRQHVQKLGVVSYDSSVAERQLFSAIAHVSSCRFSRNHRSSPDRKTRLPLNRCLSTTTSRHQHLSRQYDPSRQPVDQKTSASLKQQPDPGGGSPPGSLQESQLRQAQRGFFNSHVEELSELSHLPQGFYEDVSWLQRKAQDPVSEDDGWDANQTWPLQMEPERGELLEEQAPLPEQLKLLSTVRDLEEKLAQARHHLQTSMRPHPLASSNRLKAHEVLEDHGDSLTLSREDYKGLVDLYYYTNKNRFTPEAPDYSPTPTFLEDYNFALSEDFAGPEAYVNYYKDEEGYESPLKEIEEILKSKGLREISVMQKFVELLVDNNSTNRSLFEVYQKLPSPGVAFLPKGIIRIFLQRMSTPVVKTGKIMLRYLTLIDDMQKAKLPITRSEWSSAIYLAGRSFGKVTQSDMAYAFRLWREMEQEAGVKASYVTFNILFDIAVRAGKYPLADSILREMHTRGLRLNRLGRVSLMYYHGLLGDGDAVRKTYRDFVDAGEIVDTLVLNCVIASLMNAGEPAAAEQTYERMKDLQQRMSRKKRADGSDLIYRRYPRGGSMHIDRELASNSLNRVLLRASNLKKALPEHHQQLQDSMPLRPDDRTFKAMISHHANVSGNLNRLTVLLNEMIETFEIPMQAIQFQLLFKGFALHGTMRNSDTLWSAKRLELAWDTCRSLVKETQKEKAGSKESKPAPSLPSAKAAEVLLENTVVIDEHPKPKKVSPWTEFVLDLASFPVEGRESIERVHAELFDEIKIKAGKFKNPFFTAPPEQPNLQESHYSLGNSSFDHEEGEYTLPSPAESIHANGLSQSIPQGDGSVSEDEQRDDSNNTGQVRLTRGLICWLLRAYARCTGSRERVERVWNSVRLLWVPENETQRQSVLRVLRRCLKDCDTYGGHML